MLHAVCKEKISLNSTEPLPLRIDSCHFSIPPHIQSYIFLCSALLQMGLAVKNVPASAGDIRDPGMILGQEDPLEKGMATHSSIVAWRIPWTEEPSGLQFIALQRLKHN